ncbi:hypothetical protein Z043_118012, partial [Scleropages formosus]
VNPIQMNVGDGVAVSKDLKKEHRIMVGNLPSQKLPPDLTADLPLDRKQGPTADLKNLVSLKSGHVKNCLEAPVTFSYDSTALLSPALQTTALQEQTKVCKNVDGDELVAPLNQDPTDPTKKTHTQPQTVINLPPGVQCSSHFKAGQPIAFLVPSNSESPVGKIALHSLGQVAALSADSHMQGTSSAMSTQLRAYSYHLSIGRALAPEAELPTATRKPACGTLSSRKSFKARKEHTLTQESVPSPAGPFPLKQSTLDSVPVLPLSISPSSHTCSTQASINAPSRMLNEMEKCPSTNVPHSVENASLTYARLKSLRSTEEHPTVCIGEARDLPLDLSSKSKRQKTEAEKALLSDPHLESGQNDTMASKKIHQTQANIAPTVPYAILLDTMRNGAPPKNGITLLNHQVLEPSTSYSKISVNGSINLPGTYVGVANPVLASTLCSKDGKNSAFLEDLQSLGRPETISIIDQGDQLVSKGKKGSPVKRDAQKFHSKHLSSIQKNGDAGQPKDVIPRVYNRQSHCKIGAKKAVVPHSPKVNQMTLLPDLTASVQKKATERSPQPWTSTNTQDTVLQNSPKRVEEKQEISKWCFSSSMSTVKQGSPKMSGPASQACCNPIALDPERVSSLPPSPLESPTWQKREPSNSSPPTKRDVKLKRSSPSGTPSGIARNDAALGGKAVEECAKQEDITEKRHEPQNSRPVHNQVPGGCCQNKGKVKRRSSLVFEAGDSTKDERPLTACTSPRVKLDGVAFSILTGKSTAVTQLGEETNGTSGVKEGCTTSRAIVNKCKKSRQSKRVKTLQDPLGISITKHHKEVPVIKNQQQAKKLKVRLGPVVEPSQPGVRERKRPLEGKGSAPMEELSYSKAGVLTRSLSLCSTGDGNSCPVTPLNLRGTSGRLIGSAAEVWSSEGGAAKPKRGRRRAEEIERRDHGSSTAAPLALPPPPRRPRGRPRSTPRPNEAQQTPVAAGRRSMEHAGVEKKRKRCKNRRYQNGEYVMERDVSRDEPNRKCVTTRRAARDEAVQKMGGIYPRLRTTLPGRSASPDSCSRGVLLTHAGSSRHSDPSTAAELADKPSGKRKFKSKHLSNEEEEEKLKNKSGPLGKRSSSLITDVNSTPLKKRSSPGSVSSPKGLPSATACRRGITRRRGAAESALSRPVPPEVRRLIVNKNAGETLLQRAARLGYQEVVQYCLERDVREVNRRDNAGYTALHEASAQGWAAIVRLLLDHGADVNCSAQDGTRPIHDAVANDNMTVVWMLLSHGADPTLATYSGQNALKLAQSSGMKTFLMEYCADLDGRPCEDPNLQWDFYSSVVLETEEKECWDFLLSLPEVSEPDGDAALEEEETDAEDGFSFEFSEEPHLPCYHVQVSLSQGYCNWFLLSDVLRRLKTSARIFQARYPHFEVVGMPRVGLRQQVSLSQIAPMPEELLREGDGDSDSPVQLVRCVPDLQRLLGSSVHCLEREQLSVDPCSR